MKKIIGLILFALLVVGVAPAFAQRSISGHDTPELISDRVAARIFLSMVSEHVGKSKDARLVQLRIDQAGLKGFEANVAVFANKHSVLRGPKDNDGASVENGLYESVDNFLASLSPRARDKFIAFLQGEKRLMSVSPDDVGLLASVRNLPHLIPASYHPGMPQGLADMTPKYSTYMPNATMDEFNYYGEVYVSGYTNCLQPSVRCGVANHTPKAILTYCYNNGASCYGGYVWGPTVKPQTWTSADNVVDVPIASLYTSGTFTGTGTSAGQVECTLAGLIYSASGNGTGAPGFDWEIAETGVISLSVPPVGTAANGKHYWLVAYNCTTATSPPDWQPNQVLDYTDQTNYAGITLCVSFGFGWICPAKVAEVLHNEPLLKVLTTAEPISAAITPIDCTKSGASTGTNFGSWIW